MPDLFTAQQLAEYLQLSKRTIYRLVERNQIPAVRVGGQWRFPKSTVDYWLDVRLSGFGTGDLHELEADASGAPVSLHESLAEQNALIRVPAAGPAAVVRAFVSEVRFPELVDAEMVVQGVLERESACSTAMPGGIAVLHTARWQPRVLRTHNVLAIGRLSAPIDFGALDGGQTEVLALVLANNERNHLVLLTKMTRLCHERAFVHQLRDAVSASAVTALLASFELSVFQSALADGG